MEYQVTEEGNKLQESINAAIQLLEDNGFETQEMLEDGREPEAMIVLKAIYDELDEDELNQLEEWNDNLNLKHQIKELLEAKLIEEVK